MVKSSVIRSIDYFDKIHKCDGQAVSQIAIVYTVYLHCICVASGVIINRQGVYFIRICSASLNETKLYTRHGETRDSANVHEF